MEPASSRPAIRPARADDAPAIARLAAGALAAKYRPALGARAVPALEALVRRDLAGRGSARRWVAELDGRVAGAVALSLDEEPDAGVPRALMGAVGLPRAVRATLVLGVLAHGRLAADEAYIDELAVDAAARRRGIGRALVEACAAAAIDAGRGRLTLWVTVDNAPALALYAAAGFREARRRRWIVGRALFGSPGAILMERRLAPPGG